MEPLFLAFFFMNQVLYNDGNYRTLHIVSKTVIVGDKEPSTPSTSEAIKFTIKIEEVPILEHLNSTLRISNLEIKQKIRLMEEIPDQLKIWKKKQIPFVFYGFDVYLKYFKPNVFHQLYVNTREGT